MKITTLQAFLFCRHRFRNPLHLRFWVGERILWKRDTTLIRVGTDLRLVGYAPGPASEKVAQLINRNLRSALVNADPTKIEALRKKILQRRPQFPGIYEAYGALEIALPDLKGKAEGSRVRADKFKDERPHLSYASSGVPIGPEKC